MSVMNSFTRNVALAAWVLIGVPAIAQAQTQPAPQPQSPSSRTNYRGMELGVDVTAGRNGEAALSLGASSTRGTLAVRFSRMDAGVAVPCSIGVMYEKLFTRDRAKMTPVAGASFGRVFSCAEGATPAARSVGTISAGVRIPMFTGSHVVGSLRVAAFGQRQYGSSATTDVTSKGVSVGFVLGRR